eukprot:1194632-Prorocentrum_minimum.AAC.7
MLRTRSMPSSQMVLAYGPQRENIPGAGTNRRRVGRIYPGEKLAHLRAASSPLEPRLCPPARWARPWPPAW